MTQKIVKLGNRKAIENTLRMKLSRVEIREERDELIATPNMISEWIKELYGVSVSPRTVRNHLSEIVGTEINGIPKRFQMGGMWLILRDDPPEGESKLQNSPDFKCVLPSCGKVWDVDDISDGKSFRCVCGQFYIKEGSEINPTLRIRIGERVDLLENRLVATIGNRESGEKDLVFTLVKGEDEIIQRHHLNLPFNVEKKLSIENAGRWKYFDRLQALLLDKDTNVTYMSNSIRWMDPPFRGATIGGIVAIVAPPNPLVTVAGVIGGGLLEAFAKTAR